MSFSESFFSPRPVSPVITDVYWDTVPVIPDESFDHDPNRSPFISYFGRRCREARDEGRLSPELALCFLSRGTWASLQVADIKVLRSMEERLLSDDKTLPDFFTDAKTALDDLENQLHTYFASPGGRAELSPESSTVGISQRVGGFSDSLKMLVLKRHGNVCMVSGEPDPDVCPIYPGPASFITMSPQGAPKSIIGVLSRLYGTGQSNAVGERLHSNKRGILSSPQNYVCLSSHYRKLWQTGHLAFKPEEPEWNEETRRFEMTLTLHWMKRVGNSPFGPRTHAEIDFRRGLTAADKIHQQQWTENADHDASDSQAETLSAEQRVVILSEARAENLPSFDILKVQWDFIRVNSLCGGVGVHRVGSSVESDHARTGSDGVRGVIVVRGTWE